MKRIRLENPNISLIDLETKAREEVMSSGPKSRAYYRAQATRKMAGKEDAKKAFSKQLAAEAEAERAAEEEAARKAAEAEVKKDDGVCRIFFDPPHYTVMESVGTFEVTVVREGGDMSQTIQVDYKTEDGTASHEGDYIEAIGTLTFGPGETQKHVTLEVLDDDVFEGQGADGLDVVSLAGGRSILGLVVHLDSLVHVSALADDGDREAACGLHDGVVRGVKEDAAHTIILLLSSLGSLGLGSLSISLLGLSLGSQLLAEGLLGVLLAGHLAGGLGSVVGTGLGAGGHDLLPGLGLQVDHADVGVLEADSLHGRDVGT